MLKTRYVTNVFLGTCQNLQNSYFNEIFSMYAKQKLRPVVSPGGNKRA